MPLSTFRNFLGAGLAGETISSRLKRILAAEDELAPGFDLEPWWQEQFIAELSVRLEPFEGLTTSRDWLAALSDVSGIEGLEAVGDLSLRDLWSLREDAALRAALTARVEIIRLGLSRVNPAYFNSAQSLGALYETVLEGERSFEFVAALTRFLGDFGDMKRLHEEVAKALEDK